MAPHASAAELASGTYGIVSSLQAVWHHANLLPTSIVTDLHS